ncbi:MAG: type II toxin-antitoxin system RelE/ParE family toxin [Candidatus Gastranaerophilales bacterium]|nr:type II toxin-antitoxin system RelE/ParE family toxin [Candidatus Gastranaerophilales bacterium]
MIVQFSETSIKSLIVIDKANARRIKERINKFIESPQSCNFKKLKGYNGRYRIRQGDYRIICEFKETSIKILYILDIKHRKEAYKE